MAYPDDFSMRAYDAAQGRDETPEPDAADCYEAARDLLQAMEGGRMRGDRSNYYIIALRRAVAAETSRRAADAAELRAACGRLRILGRVG